MQLSGCFSNTVVIVMLHILMSNSDNLVLKGRLS
jgi:hypothetical protein